MVYSRVEYVLQSTFSISSIVGWRSMPKSINVHWIHSRSYSSCSNMNIWWLKYCWSLSFVKFMQSWLKPLNWEKKIETENKNIKKSTRNRYNIKLGFFGWYFKIIKFLEIEWLLLYMRVCIVSVICYIHIYLTLICHKHIASRYSRHYNWQTNSFVKRHIAMLSFQKSKKAGRQRYSLQN